jgi:hypothetical protein
MRYGLKSERLDPTDKQRAQLESNKHEYFTSWQSGVPNQTESAAHRVLWTHLWSNQTTFSMDATRKAQVIASEKNLHRSDEN